MRFRSGFEIQRYIKSAIMCNCHGRSYGIPRTSAVFSYAALYACVMIARAYFHDDAAADLGRGIARRIYQTFVWILSSISILFCLGRKASSAG